MIPAHANRVLLWGAAAHMLGTVLCLFLLQLKATHILGVHPALKPMKFGISIAVFLATMAALVPALGVKSGVRNGVAWILVATMLAEMVPISLQAIRGTTSHFNTKGPFNAAMWQLMFSAIVLATITMVGVILVATVRPLNGADGRPMDSLLATAWRAGLWLFALVVFTGLSMGGRMRHSVGGEDGGPGLPLVNWSVQHGDLRVSHFVALHAMQTLPLTAIALGSLPVGGAARWTVLIVAIAVHVIGAGGTWLQALARRPLF